MDDLGLREDWATVRRGLPTKAVGPNTAAMLAAVARIDARLAASQPAPRLTPDREALREAAGRYVAALDYHRTHVDYDGANAQEVSRTLRSLRALTNEGDAS